MQKYLHKILNDHRRKVITSNQLEAQVMKQMGEGAWEREGGYEAFAALVEKLVEEKLIAPVVASGFNGRVPPLAVRYRIINKINSTPPELFRFRSQMDFSYFHRNLEEFYRYQKVLHNIDKYLLETAGKDLEVWDTVNERSLMLAGDEKFFSSSHGVKLLGKINVSLNDLHCHKVTEPFFYQEFIKREGASRDTIYGLIVENKDTFSTICRLLRSCYLRLFPSMNMVIYGEGNKITRSWSFLDAIPWVKGKKVQLFYFGDLDPEGINIYCRLLTAVEKKRRETTEEREVALPALELAESLYSLLLKQGISRFLGKEIAESDLINLNTACKEFAPEIKDEIINLWHDGKIVPQEALSASRLAAIGDVKL